MTNQVLGVQKFGAGSFSGKPCANRKSSQEGCTCILCGVMHRHGNGVLRNELRLTVRSTRPHCVTAYVAPRALGARPLRGTFLKRRSSEVTRPLAIRRSERGHAL